MAESRLGCGLVDGIRREKGVVKVSVKGQDRASGVQLRVRARIRG